MRSPRHWFKKRYGEWRIGPRRIELQREMSEALGRPVTLTPFGDGGNDSIYLASVGDDGESAVVRLYNPFKKDFLRWRKLRSIGPWPRTTGQKAPARKDPMKALNREWDAYEALAGSGVTPRPLWRTRDATAVSHLPGVRLNRRLAGLASGAWRDPVRAAFLSLARIHECGRAHHDAKTSNVIYDPSTGKASFIDLDRFTAKGESLAYQQTFDYLKLLASFLQAAPGDLRKDGPFWFRAIEPLVPERLRRVDVEPMLNDKSVRHLARSRQVREALAPVFSRIGDRKEF